MQRLTAAAITAVILSILGIASIVGFALVMAQQKAAWTQAGAPIAFWQELLVGAGDWVGAFWPLLAGMWLFFSVVISFSVCTLASRRSTETIQKS